MLCALTVRRLKPGSFEDYRKAWDIEVPGWRAYTVRNVDDENEVVSFGFFDGSMEDLRKSQQDFDYEGFRKQVDQFVESTGTDGIYEVVVEQGRS
jgi:hypothetical protein